MLANHGEDCKHDPVALALQYPNYTVATVTLNSFLRICNNATFYTLILFMVETHKKYTILSNMTGLFSPSIKIIICVPQVQHHSAGPAGEIKYHYPQPNVACPG